MDNVREDLEDRGIQLSMAFGKTKNREVWRNNKGLIVSKPMEGKKEEEDERMIASYYRSRI